MSYTDEFEEILASIHKDKEKLNQLLAYSNQSEENNDMTMQKPLSRSQRNAQPVVTSQPETHSDDTALSDEHLIEVPKENVCKNIDDEPVIENTAIETESEILLESPVPSINIEESSVAENTESKEEKTEKIPFKARFTALLRLAKQKFITRQMGIVLVIIASIAVVIIAGVKIYDYSKTAYLKPYEQKYNITYPDGILEQFCDQYGKQQDTVGAIQISDLDSSVYVTSNRTRGHAYAPKGTDVFSNQQFRAIDVTSRLDIESIYSAKEGFINASQKITFNTLFEKNEYQVIGAYYTNKNSDDDNGYVFPYNIYGNLTEKSFNHFADSIKHRSIYDTGYEMTYDKSYISIYSDSDFMHDFVFVIVCVKTNGNFEKITDVNDKEKIHYPDCWYIANNTDNPYFLSGRWYPEIIVNPETEKCRKLTAEDYEFK